MVLKLIYRCLAGMSVTGGYFIGDNITVFVAGAPRSNETGQVILFVKSQKGTTDNNWREYLIINGEQIASNFGYQVASADVNGDKYVLMEKSKISNHRLESNGT